MCKLPAQKNRYLIKGRYILQKKSSRIRFPIGLKLSIIVAIILAVSLSIITVLMSFMTGNDVRLAAENNNWLINRWSADAAGNILRTNSEKSLFLIRNIEAVMDEDQENIDILVSRFFRLNPDIYSVAFVGLAGSPGGMVVNENFSSLRGVFFQWLMGHEYNLGQASAGKTLLYNASSDLDFSCLVMFFPLYAEGGFNFSGAGIVFFSASLLETSLNQGFQTASGVVSGEINGKNHDHVSFIVNNSAEIIVSPKNSNFIANQSVFAYEAIQNNVNAIQMAFTVEDSQYFGAFERLPGFEAAMVTQIRSDLIDTRVFIEVFKIGIIGLIVMLISIFVIARYSKTITVPLKALISGVNAIENNNYQPGLKINSRDEIGVLTSSFISMGHGLANFERFTNKQLVALAKKGELGLTGVKRNVTICFTMIQNFNALTSGMDTKQLFIFINQLLAGLVPCVTNTGGLVDKFLTQEGLVIMSLWGAAESQGNPRSDAINCIQSALKMRNALRQINEKRFSGSGSRILAKMSCGINSGEVVAGQMGSEERMEYTVIGDAVNLAARLQEPNEAFNTDILISEETSRLISSDIVSREMPSIEVKGKSEVLRVFSVINFKNYFGPSTLEEVRQSWRI